MMGTLVNFAFSEVYRNLPVVFGNGLEFYSFYKDLEYSDFQSIKLNHFIILTLVGGIYFYGTGKQ